jgi:hypothetical protein
MTAEPVGMLQVLSKTMDSTTLSPEKIELSTVQRDEDSDEVNRLRFILKPCDSAVACICKQSMFRAV